MLVVVHTDDADVLLLKRIRPFEFWQSVTGSLDAHELPEQAARRELAEETGLDREGRLEDSGQTRTFTIDPRWRDRYPPGVTQNLEHEWRYRLASPTNIRMAQDEHSEWRWVPIDEAIETVWSWTNRDALEQLKTELAGQASAPSRRRRPRART